MLFRSATVTKVLSVTTQTFAAAVVKGKASAVQPSTSRKLEKGDMVQVTKLALTSANNSLANGDVVTTTFVPEPAHPGVLGIERDLKRRCKVTAVVQDVIGGAITRDIRQDCADTVVSASAIRGGSPFFGDPFFNTAQPFFSSSSAQATSAALASSTSTSSSATTQAESSTTKSTASEKATSSTSASGSASSSSAVAGTSPGTSPRPAPDLIHARFSGNTQGGIGITVQSITQIATSDITVSAESAASSSSLTGPHPFDSTRAPRR